MLVFLKRESLFDARPSDPPSCFTREKRNIQALNNFHLEATEPHTLPINRDSHYPPPLPMQIQTEAEQEKDMQAREENAAAHFCLPN